MSAPLNVNVEPAATEPGLFAVIVRLVDADIVKEEVEPVWVPSVTVIVVAPDDAMTIVSDQRELVTPVRDIGVPPFTE